MENTYDTFTDLRCTANRKLCLYSISMWNAKYTNIIIQTISKYTHAF